MGRKAGITEEQLHDLTRFETSPHFNEREKLVLRLATAMTHTPADVSDELFAALRNEFSERQMVELSSAVAWENYRARFNRTFAIEAEGFSKGHFCPLAERWGSTKKVELCESGPPYLQPGVTRPRNAQVPNDFNPLEIRDVSLLWFEHSGNRFEPLCKSLLRCGFAGHKAWDGRTTIANSDSDGHAYTNIAIDQADRAVEEVVAIDKVVEKSAW